MSGDKLSPLQWRILRILARVDPPFVLTGGAALAAVYLKMRPTRDLDLFWHDRAQLGDLPRIVHDLLRAEHLAVDAIQGAVTFHRLRVSDGTDTCVVDLVADQVPTVEAPVAVSLGLGRILVDGRQEILANKLCALLGRCELRDLQDVKALVECGADLDRALRDAPQKDGGFSALTLAWVLQGFPAKTLAGTLGLSEDDADELDRFRRALIERLLATSAPG